MKYSVYWILLGLMLGISACQQSEKPLENLTPCQQTAIYYLYHPALISDTFARMLWKLPVDCRGLDPEKNLLYFSFKKELGKEKVVQALALDTSLLEFAPCEEGPCEFGGLSGRIDGHYAFRMPTYNLKVDSALTLPLALKTPGRSITLSALAAEMDSNQTYHTDPYMYLHWGEFGEKIPAGNVGAYISKPGKDPLITRLAEELTKGLSTPEEKAQKLLDFVSNEVSYSYEDHWYRTEITKRAHEVLLAGQGDCSGKSTLYASLLEVLHIPYCLLYFDRHVNVGVQGKFPRENGYIFELAGATYAMAEPTVEKFRIGITKLQEAAQLREVFYYQIPSNKPEIHDVKRNILLQTTRSLEPEEPETE